MRPGPGAKREREVSHAMGRRAGKRERRGRPRRGFFDRRPRGGTGLRGPDRSASRLVAHRDQPGAPSQHGAADTVLSAPALPRASPRRTAAPKDQLGKFASVVLASTEDVWKDIFAKKGRTYHPPHARSVLRRDPIRLRVRIGRGRVPSIANRTRRSISISRFSRSSRPGSAPAVISPTLTSSRTRSATTFRTSSGIFDQLGRSRSRRDNSVSVALELQADCYAGVWGYHANRDRHMIEPGDFEEGPARGFRDRRRPAPAPDPGLRGAGDLHSRNLAGTRGLAAPRPRIGGSGQVRHVQRLSE